MSDRTLAEMMTWNIVTIEQHASLEEATHVMATAHISSVLATDAGKPVGIVTERDVLCALDASVPRSAPVSGVMGKPLVGAPKDMTMHDAYHYMVTKGVRHLLVTDPEGNPLGIVSESDFRFHLGLAFYRRLQDVRMVMSARMPVLPPTVPVREAVSAMALRNANCCVVTVDNKPVGMLTERDAVYLYRDQEHALDRPLAELMSHPVQTIPVGTHLHDALERMQSGRIRHLVVVGDDGGVAGVLSEHDIVRQLETEYLDFSLRDNRRARKQLQESEIRRRAVFNQSRQYIGLLDLEGRLLDANRPALELIGDPDPGDVIGKHFWDTPWWSHDTALQERLRRAFGDALSGRSTRFETTHSAADGTLHYVDFQLHPIVDDDGKLALVMAEGSDITERHRIEEQRRLALRVFQSSHDGIMVTDPDGIILDVNQAFSNLTGYARDEAVGKSYRLLDSGHHDPAFFEEVFATIARQDHWLGEIWNRTKSGEISVVLMTLSAVRDAAGQLTHYVGVFTDITQKKESERRLEHLAQHDALTDLPNRSLFRDRLYQAIKKCQRDRQTLAVLFIDLDRFKEVNDSLGHIAGDALLVEAAQRIVGCLRSSDTVARLGGDEFTVVLLDLDGREAAATVAREIIAALAKPFNLKDATVAISASVGIAIYPEDGIEPDLLTNAADQAMYRAKAQGRNGYTFLCA